MKLEEIKKHWEKSGEGFPFGSKVTPTSRDPYLGELERENIISYLNVDQTCLELGCGDAYHTIHYAKKVKRLLGIDVAESLISIANKRLKKEALVNVDLCVGSVLDIEKIFKGKQFNCIISQRCLINLPTWENQKNAIAQVYQLLAKKGIFILTEGFQDNLDNLNSVRIEMSLPKIEVVEYNRNFATVEFEKFIQKHFEIIGKHYYGGYLFISRIYHPLVALPESPKHDSKMNEVAMNLQKKISMPDLDKYSYNVAYVLRKRDVR